MGRFEETAKRIDHYYEGLLPDVDVHQSDPTKNYRMSLIKDDNNDGIIEVNRPEEIDALLTSVKNYLNNTGFPLRKALVWVSTAGLTHQRKAEISHVKSMKRQLMHPCINFPMT
jgi:hypothetical protein